jgi:transposase
MRGADKRQRAMLVVINPEQRIPQDHPLRRIKALADAALKELSPVFDEMYSAVGRPSIPPERLSKVSVLMALHTVRSERLLCEQLDYNFLFRWFLDLEADEAAFDHSTFSRNRARLLRRKRNHYRGIFRTLGLVNGDRIGGDDLIELAEVVVDQPAIKVEHELLGLRVNRLNEPEVAIEDIFVVVVDGLHHLVAAPK